MKLNKYVLMSKFTMKNNTTNNKKIIKNVLEIKLFFILKIMLINVKELFIV